MVKLNKHFHNTLQLGEMDHYTLIVSNAKKVAENHEHILGFKLLEVRELNLNDPEYCMINYILQLPNESEKFCVITEGLTNTSIFRKLMNKYGEGIHHVAYNSNAIEKAFKKLQKVNIKLTSEMILNDPITNLKQFFIDRSYFGYFIEIIERKSINFPTIFANKNMSGLAKTMKKFIK